MSQQGHQESLGIGQAPFILPRGEKGQMEDTEKV
jgi:hypothetical protein